MKVQVMFRKVPHWKHKLVKKSKAELSSSDGKRVINTLSIFLQLPLIDLCNLCSLLDRERQSDKVCMLAGEVLKKLASVATSYRKFFAFELSELAPCLGNSAVREHVTLRNMHLLGLSAGSMAGAVILRVLQALSSLTTSSVDENVGLEGDEEQEEQIILRNLNVALELLWRELRECISVTEMQLD